MLLISALLRQRQEDYTLETSLVYTVRACLKKKKKNNINKKKNEENLF